MNKTRFIIEANFGSKFQEKFGRETLMAMGKAFKYHMRQSHSKNKIDVRISSVYEPYEMIEPS